MSLSDYRGRSSVVLYFYPKDDTPGCTTESCSFRDMLPDFEAAGSAILGISPDDADSHRKFAEKHALPFPLLADPDHAVAEAYGVWKEKNNYGKKYWGIERTTFVIGRDGTLGDRSTPRVKVDRSHAWLRAKVLVVAFVPGSSSRSRTPPIRAHRGFKARPRRRRPEATAASTTGRRRPGPLGSGPAPAPTADAPARPGRAAAAPDAPEPPKNG